MRFKEIVLSPIGMVRTRSADSEVSESFDGVPGKIEIFEEYSEGLEGIEGFSHIIVIAFLDRVNAAERRVLKVRPKWLVKYADETKAVPEVGVFNTRSPHRPNPIALSVVRLVRRTGNVLEVEGLDLYDGTPVLDLKPHVPQNHGAEIRFPSWFDEMRERVRKEKGKELTF
ncbi:MAG: tRNA (N6-threonylcarbamoyladenosine(37)-N6)-methyltransferase TrmO [Candidatus Methanosuratincola sp.]|jgi:tRNA-Thr(GGU) m(6)t(6)A37 methyltransferase TsaA|nr:tRNA (N6-threonylcarbamoyladenosine(37)-N6)-methyltransferase TrmO [Candidatus Methanosuratincola sp.]